MQLIKNQNLNKGDIFFNKTRRISGLIINIFKYSGEVSIEYIEECGRPRNVYFRDNEEIFKIEDDVKIKSFLNAKVEYDRAEGAKNVRWVGGSLGSDPECFVTDKNGKLIPSYKFLKSKEDKDLTGKASDLITTGSRNNESGNQPIFWDGFQAEFNVKDSDCLAWVCDSTFIGLKTLQKKAREYNPDAKLTLQSTFDIDQNTLDNAKKEHVEFGCMPSFNVYGLKGLIADGRDVPFRSAGGHIHFGIKNFTEHANGIVNQAKVDKYVKALDMILGVACVSLFEKYDSPRRRRMYGLAGEYRLPTHGLEYRTLSNAWLCHPLIMNMVFELGRKVIGAANDGLMEYWDSTETETIRCINDCDVDLAREILARNKQLFTGLIYSHCRDEVKALNIYKIYMLGLHSIIENPDDIETNWGLDSITKYVGHCEGKGMSIRHIEQLPKYADIETEKVTEIYEEMVAEIKKLDEAPIIGKKKQTA